MCGRFPRIRIARRVYVRKTSIALATSASIAFVASADRTWKNVTSPDAPMRCSRVVQDFVAATLLRLAVSRYK